MFGGGTTPLLITVEIFTPPPTHNNLPVADIVVNLDSAFYYSRCNCVIPEFSVHFFNTEVQRNGVTQRGFYTIKMFFSGTRFSNAEIKWRGAE